MFDILQEITRQRTKRGWSEYKLAKQADMAQTTINGWYRRKQIPSVPNIERICKGLGISLAQFFAEGEDSFPLTDEQKKLLDDYAALTPQLQADIRNTIEHILENQKL